MDIKIPRLQVSVKVFFHHYGLEACDFFLAENSERHTGPETMDEFLNFDPREFIPVRLQESGNIMLISKKFIETVLVPADSKALGDMHGVPPTRETPVKVTMTDERSYTGIIRIFNPAYEARVTDFLNGTEPFFQLQLPEQVAYINKLFLSRLEEV